MSIAQVTNLGICGMPFCGPDIGGFNDDCTPELFARWMQMGVLFPYARAHSAQGTRDQEPWSFGSEVLDVARAAVDLRYRLLPYLYTLVADMVRQGDLMLRPMYYAYPDDTCALQADDQAMLGPDLLFAPIMAAGRTYRAVYLPQGWWLDWGQGTWHRGGQVLVAHASLHEMPLYVRGGALLPLAPPGAQRVRPESIPEVEWHLFVPPVDEPVEVAGWLYDDDGESDPEGRARGAFAETHIRGSASRRGAELEVAARLGGYDPGARRFTLRAVGLSDEAWPDVVVTDDGQPRVVRLGSPVS